MTYFDFSKNELWHFLTFIDFFWSQYDFPWILNLFDVFWHSMWIFLTFFDSAWHFLTSRIGVPWIFRLIFFDILKRYFWQFLTLKKMFTRPGDVFWHKLSNNVKRACKNLKNCRLWHYFWHSESSSVISV